MKNEQRTDENQTYPGLTRSIRTPPRPTPKKKRPGRSVSEKPSEKDSIKKGLCKRIELPNVPWLFPQG
jgi:hypothetical protein